MFRIPQKNSLVLVRILLVLAVASLFFVSREIKAQTETEPADNFQLQTYLTEEQALALVFPESDEIAADEFAMTPEEKGGLEKLLSRRLYEDGFRVYVGKKHGAILGYAIITEEIGKFHPFTFIVGVSPDGKIDNMAVLVYRESRGGEIAKKRFLYQFIGKSFKNPIRINKDIINITGATMSVQYMCAGVRKVLAVIQEYYLSGKRDVSALKAVNGGGEKSGAAAHAPKDTQAGNAKGQDSDLKLLKQTRMIMGTFAEVSVYARDEKAAGKAIDAALNEMERMDRVMSNYKSDSELSQLNKQAVNSPVPCGGELLDVIERSQYYSELSGGAFDVTVSPVVALWGFFREKANVPSGKEIERTLPAVSYKNITIDKSGGSKNPATIFFKNPQTQIDLGGIGKGYAVDKALDAVKRHGIDNACINLGGNIYALGAPPGKTGWRIGVQHPRNKGELLGCLELRDEATATSGDYERFFEIKGKRYSHIINPKTGTPVQGTIAVTVVAPNGTEVDALSTSVFVLGPEKGLQLVKNIPGADVMIVYEGKDGKMATEMTKGFRDKLKKSGI